MDCRITASLEQIFTAWLRSKGKISKQSSLDVIELEFQRFCWLKPSVILLDDAFSLSGIQISHEIHHGLPQRGGTYSATLHLPEPLNASESTNAGTYSFLARHIISSRAF